MVGGICWVRKSHPQYGEKYFGDYQDGEQVECLVRRDGFQEGIIYKSYSVINYHLI